MTFESSTEFTPNFFQHWVSTGGKWEIGFTQMMFGVRVRFGEVGCGACCLDYCAGDDFQFQQELMRVVKIILLDVPESIQPGELCRMFPTYDVKPIHRDPCWAELKKMADLTLEKLNHETKNQDQQRSA